MRIIAGKHKGRKIETGTAAPHVRPTSGFAREAIFNIINHGTYAAGYRGRAVADLCCGSGAFGLEALSRGAGRVTFVDMDHHVLQNARANAERMHETDNAAFLRADVSRLPQAASPFALVFLDPPYFSGLIPQTLEALHFQGWLDADSVVVIEHDARERPPIPPAFVEVDERRYGRACIRLVRLAPVPRQTAGFTLLELAIAMVIIGLLLGGVLVGRNIIRAAELERLVDAKAQLNSSLNLFQARFGQWPGDFDNYSNALNGAAGGDGNGIISYKDGGASDTWQEVENVYVHLSAAGILGTSYVPANLHVDAGGGGPFMWNIGTDAPQGPDNNTVFWIGAQASSFYGRPALSVNTIMLTGIDIREGAVSLQDAFALDSKFDDGLADSGAIRSYRPWDGVGGANTCTTNVATAASASYLNPDAVTSQSPKDCVIELATF